MRHRRRVHAAGAVIGAVAAAGVGFAPHAVASDAQSRQWYLQPMQADQMWKHSTGKGVKVAVIDTGVNPHTDSLEGQVLVNEVPKAVAYGAADDYTGHGTSMAELIAGTGANGGVQGLAPDAKIVPYRIHLNGLTGAEDKKKTALPAQAIKAAADTDAKIISMSFGSPYYDPDVEAAITYAASKGKMLIASVGNNGDTGEDNIGYPAAARYVVGVSSMGKDRNLSKFSSTGNYVDLVAPGEGVPGYCQPSFTSYCPDLSGTSASTAIASGSAALIWSAHPDWTANQVTRALIDTASRNWPKDKPTEHAGYGTIRPRKVLENPNYDAGPAYSDPLAKWNQEKGETLVTEIPPASAASPSATASSQAPEASSGADKAAAGSKGEKTEKAAAESSGDDNSTLWIVLGAAAAVVVVGGGAFALLRARRAT
ncbi:serine protease [Streptomyces sp. NWU339]|nr:serine protease [Streptomyces sp. NWU339]